MGQWYTKQTRSPIDEWVMFEDSIREFFQMDLADDCRDRGIPLPEKTEPEVMVLRQTSDGSQDDRGELITLVECDLKDHRALWVELRLAWEA